MRRVIRSWIEMLRAVAYPAIGVVVGVSVVGALILGSTIPVLTPAFPILLGVLAFFAGQFVLKFVFEPVITLRRTISEIGSALTYYADLYSNPGDNSREDRTEARKELRRLASLLSAQQCGAIWYGLSHKLNLVPDAISVLDASTWLIGLSNNLSRGDPAENDERCTRITELLGLNDREPK